MGQEPNIEIDWAERPHAEPERPPERRWVPSRPGEITAPEDMPDGPRFGHPGPDTGYGLLLLRMADYDREAAGPYSEDVLVLIIGARASHYGRAPTPEDVEVALVLLGLHTDGVEPATLQHLAARREAWLHAAAHELPRGETALSEIPLDLLLETPINLRTRLNRDPTLVGEPPT